MCTLSGSYNTTINEPTGSSPSQILLGMQPRREWDGRELAPDDVTQQPAGDEKAASTAASGRSAALSASLTHVLVEARSPEIRRVGLPEHHAADPVAVFLHASDLSITAPGAHKPRPFLTMSRAHQKTAIAAYRSLIAEHVTVEALRRTYGDSAPSVDTVRGEFKGESQLDADRLPLIANLHKANVFCLHGSYNPEEKGSQPVTCHSFEPGWCSIAVYLTATAGDDSDSLSADSPVLEVLERASTGSRLWEPGNAVPQVICFVYPT
jgi:hypothetical protein